MMSQPQLHLLHNSKVSSLSCCVYISKNYKDNFRNEKKQKFFLKGFPCGQIICWESDCKSDNSDLFVKGSKQLII